MPIASTRPGAPQPDPRLPPAWRRGLALAVLVGACGFFEELQSVESAEDTQGDGDDDTATDLPNEEDAACSWPEDDVCLDQDRLIRCDPATLAATPYDCAAVCGSLVNMACVNSADGHACYCATPGAFRDSTCTVLEACLGTCTDPTDEDCSKRCLARTDRSTIRLYGALVHCVHAQCNDTCNDSPELCAPCITAGMQTGTGECSLARSICNADGEDDPFDAYD